MKKTDERFKQCLIDTYKAFKDFCDSKKLKFYAAYGTAIGAIRHHGLIPWDDDVDVYMMRGDYEKLLELKGEISEGYDVMERSKDEYCHTFMKFVNTNTTVWEKKEYPYLLGVYIDIFPLDECEESEALQIKAQYIKDSIKWQRSLTKYTFGDFINGLIHMKRDYELKLLSDIFYYHFFKKDAVRNYENSLKKVKSLKGDYYMSFSGPYGGKELLPKEWFAESMEFPFEDTSIYLPSEYDKYLRQLYGDYLTPPPVEKQKSVHGRYYVNISKKLNITEIKTKADGEIIDI